MTKTDAGTLVLSGINTYTGLTNVEGGTLLLPGSITSNAFIFSDAAIGGDGTIFGDLALNSGGKFVFSTSDILSVTGSVNLDSTFGVDDLIGLDSSVGIGTYTLIDTTATDFASLNIENWGFDNAYDLGSGKSAFFEQGSLQLVVGVTAVPEPSSVVLLGLVSLVGFARIRRKRDGRRTKRVNGLIVEE